MCIHIRCLSSTSFKPCLNRLGKTLLGHLSVMKHRYMYDTWCQLFDPYIVIISESYAKWVVGICHTPLRKPTVQVLYGSMEILYQYHTTYFPVYCPIQCVIWYKVSYNDVHFMFIWFLIHENLGIDTKIIILGLIEQKLWEIMWKRLVMATIFDLGHTSTLIINISTQIDSLNSSGMKYQCKSCYTVLLREYMASFKKENKGWRPFWIMGHKNPIIYFCAWHSKKSCSIDSKHQFGTRNETFASIWNEKTTLPMHGTPLLLELAPWSAPSISSGSFHEQVTPL